MNTSWRWMTFAGALLAGSLLANLCDAQNVPGAAPTQPNLQAQSPRAAGQPAQAGKAAPGQSAPGQAQPRTTLRPVQRAQDNLAQANDRQIAAMLLIDAEGEVEMGEFAQPRAKHEQVKKLAEMMVNDHGKSAAALRKIAGGAAENDKTKAAAGAVKDADALAGGAVTTTGSLDFVAIKRQIDADCLAWDKKELGGKQGTDFDIAFTGQQIDRHMEAICAARVLRQFASPELKGMIDKDVQTAEHHYEMAQQIMQRLNNERGSLQGKTDSGGQRGTAAVKQGDTKTAAPRSK